MKTIKVVFELGPRYVSRSTVLAEAPFRQTSDDCNVHDTMCHVVCHCSKYQSVKYLNGKSHPAYENNLDVPHPEFSQH